MLTVATALLVEESVARQWGCAWRSVFWHYSSPITHTRGKCLLVSVSIKLSYFLSCKGVNNLKCLSTVSLTFFQLRKCNVRAAICHFLLKGVYSYSLQVFVNNDMQTISFDKAWQGISKVVTSNIHFRHCIAICMFNVASYTCEGEVNGRSSLFSLPSFICSSNIETLYTLCMHTYFSYFCCWLSPLDTDPKMYQE